MTPLARAILAAVEAEPGQWTIASLAEDLDVTSGQVRMALQQIDRCGYHCVVPDDAPQPVVAPKPPPPVEPRPSRNIRERQERARFLHLLGLSRGEIADVMEVAPETVRNYLCKMRKPTQRERIVALHSIDPDVKAAQIARRVGCTPGFAQQVIRQYRQQGGASQPERNTPHTRDGIS